MLSFLRRIARSFRFMFVAVLLSCASLSGCMNHHVPPHPARPTVSESLPENPCPGELWCKVERPARYEDVSEKVLVQPAGIRRVLEPPVYERQCREVVVQEGYWAEIPVPATYEEVCDRICVMPAHREWKMMTCNDPCHGHRECYCLVEVPAVYQTRTRTVECAPARTCKKWVPPVMRIEDEPVEVSPACWREVEDPAVYETRSRRVKVCPKETLYVKQRAPCGPPPCPPPCAPPYLPGSGW